MMQVGDRVGPYIIQGVIGRGGMAEVYKAWHQRLNCYHALKTPLAPTNQVDSDLITNFLREARLSAHLRHPNIVTIHNVSAEGDALHYLAMEYIEDGLDLASVLKERGKMTPQEALPIVRQIADALDYAHGENIIHLDVKPSNIMLEKDGQGSYRVKVADFGIAKAIAESQEARQMQTGMIAGSPPYMSPEQVQKPLEVSKYSDIYSFGALIYEMVCGHPPFGTERDTPSLPLMMRQITEMPPPPITISGDLPKDANKAILKALAKNPEDRFASCAEFIDALAPHSRDSHRATKHKYLWMGIATTLVAVFIFVGAQHQIRHNKAIKNTATAAQMIAIGDYSQAEKIAQQAIQLDHSYEDAWLKYCTAGLNIAKSTGRFEEVKERIHQAKVLFPRSQEFNEIADDAENGVEQAKRIAQSQQKSAEAEQVNDKSFTERVDLLTKFQAGKIAQGEALRINEKLNKEFRRAEKMAKEAIDLWPDNENAWVQYGRAGFFLATIKADYQATLQRVKEAEKRFPNNEALKSIEANVIHDGEL